MQMKIFTQGLVPTKEQEEELNHFLRAHKIVDVRKELAISGGNNLWTFCITYLLDGGTPAATTTFPRNNKVDYREVLDEATFKTFSELRKIRKTLADEEAVPAYAVFTDAELAELAKLDKISTDAMLKVSGIGKKKVEKYGERFMAEMSKEQKNETSGAPF